MIDAAIILCGGRSSRMGRDKAALPFGPETLLTRVVRAAQEVAADVVVVGDTAQAMPAGVRVVGDPVPRLGPLAALATGLASVDAERSLLLGCDMPLLVPAVLRRFAEGTRSLRALLDGVSVKWVSADDLRDLDPELLSFWDCDTPEHYQAALRRAQLTTRR